MRKERLRKRITPWSGAILKKDWLSQFLETILTNPVENFKAAQRGDIPVHVPYLLLVVEVLLLPVSIILSSFFGVSFILKGVMKGLLSVFF